MPYIGCGFINQSVKAYAGSPIKNGRTHIFSRSLIGALEISPLSASS